MRSVTIPVDPIVTSLQRQPHQLAGEAVDGVALVGDDIDAREALALEGVAEHGTVPVERRTGAVDRGRALEVPAVPLTCLASSVSMRSTGLLPAEK